jgi:hypothetical protein
LDKPESSSDGLSVWIDSSRRKVAQGDFQTADLDCLEALVTSPRQQVLYLYSKSTNMRSKLAGWTLYDPTQPQAPALPSDAPPYESVIEALEDGWRIVQFPILKLYSHETVDNDYLGYEFILEKMVRTV